jgi:hypothetical protein
MSAWLVGYEQISSPKIPKAMGQYLLMRSKRDADVDSELFALDRRIDISARSAPV